MKLDYFIVLVGPDANRLVGRHQFFQSMVQGGRLNDIVKQRTGQDLIQGNLSLAMSTEEAVQAIDRNFKCTDNAVQIVCADYALGDSGGAPPGGRRILNGLDLSDYLRWNFVGKKNRLSGSGGKPAPTALP